MNDYTPEWKSGAIQASIREQAGHMCEHCGMRFNRDTNIATSAINKNGKPCIGTVHHIDGNKANMDWCNLVYVCQRCHLHIQALWKPGGVLPAQWWPVPEWIKSRNLSYVVEAIQLELFGENTA